MWQYVLLFFIFGRSELATYSLIWVIIACSKVPYCIAGL